MNTNSSSGKGRSLFAALLMAALMAISAFAQTDTTSIAGTVTDAQGAVLPDVTVTVTNAARNITRTAQTDGSGGYRFLGLPPGEYVVTAERTGFKKYQAANVQAPIASPVTHNVELSVGDVSEVVSVTAGQIESIVNTQDASLGNTFRPIQIQQLPTDSRNINGLLSLQPGVTSSGYVHGGRSDQANITLDGVDVNDQQQGGAFFSVLRPLAEATEEFRVTTTNGNADQGRSSGAQISLLTKSGSNNFRGAVFWLPRRTFGSANTFFNNSTIDEDTGENLPRPPLNRDVFGGAIGGPVVKDKFYFFYAYEGWRERISVPQTQTVPLAHLGQGIVKLTPTISIGPDEFNARYPAVRQNPAALAVLAAAAARYPANSKRAGDGLNTGGFTFNAPTSYDQNTHVLRLDWTLTPNQQIFFRANKQHDVTMQAAGFPDELSPERWDHNTGVALGHIWSIGSNKVNNFRYGLTRQAFTSGGISSTNSQSFRFVYTPTFSYGLSRITPIHNFTDDFSWTKGNHSIQFGGNIRLIRNQRVDNGSGYDNAVVNPSYYAGSGRSLLTPLAGAYPIATNNLDLQAAVAAVIGRYSQYTANYNYDIDGNVLPTGTPIEREFATEEYDVYGQDSWRIFPNLTVNFGLRYSLSRPVYETSGYQIRPAIPLGEYFENRIQGMNSGTPYNEPLNFELAGPKNNAKGWYSLDTNNFQPRISAAWSPNFRSGFLGSLFGRNNESVFRGGFSITNDYFGQQLAVTFNNLGTLGFLTSDTIGPNTFNVTSNPGPLFTGFGQQVNNFPGMAPLENRFQTPADEETRIELSLDSTLQSPINYNWNFTYGRRLPLGFYVEASYVGRKAKHLLAQRDVMMANNLVDPRSGMDWYTAAGQIYDVYYGARSWDTVAPIPYFENLFPSLAGWAADGATATQSVAYINENYAFGDWTYLQFLLDDAGTVGVSQPGWSNYFYQPQYGAFTSFGTIGNSEYHGGSISLRQRLGEALSFDINYTYSKSMDDASGLQTSGAYGSAFILNALRQKDNWSLSDFDTRHIINGNVLYQLPFGRGRQWGSGVNKWVDTFVGGWQIGSVFRWNSGTPISNLIDLAGWPTNWNLRANVVRVRPFNTSFTKNGAEGLPNLFSDLDALREAVRPARPGETGDRNVFKGIPFSQVDMNLGKSFTMPWSENHKLQFRWEVFNVFNHQYLDENSVTAYSINPPDPFIGAPSALSGRTGVPTAIRGIPRRMQFVFRYSF